MGKILDLVHPWVQFHSGLDFLRCCSAGDLGWSLHTPSAHFIKPKLFYVVSKIHPSIRTYPLSYSCAGSQGPSGANPSSLRAKNILKMQQVIIAYVQMCSWIILRWSLLTIKQCCKVLCGIPEGLLPQYRMEFVHNLELNGAVLMIWYPAKSYSVRSNSFVVWWKSPWDQMTCPLLYSDYSDRSVLLNWLMHVVLFFKGH